MSELSLDQIKISYNKYASYGEQLNLQKGQSETRLGDVKVRDENNNGHIDYFEYLEASTPVDLMKLRKKLEDDFPMGYNPEDLQFILELNPSNSDLVKVIRGRTEPYLSKATEMLLKSKPTKKELLDALDGCPLFYRGIVIDLLLSQDLTSEELLEIVKKAPTVRADLTMERFFKKNPSQREVWDMLDYCPAQYRNNIAERLLMGDPSQGVLASIIGGCDGPVMNSAAEMLMSKKGSVHDDPLSYIRLLLNVIKKCREPLKEKAWERIVSLDNPMMAHLCWVVRDIIEPYKEKAWELYMSRKPSHADLQDAVMYLSDHYQAGGYQKKAAEMLLASDPTNKDLIFVSIYCGGDYESRAMDMMLKRGPSDEDLNQMLYFGSDANRSKTAMMILDKDDKGTAASNYLLTQIVTLCPEPYAGRAWEKLIKRDPTGQDIYKIAFEGDSKDYRSIAISFIKKAIKEDRANIDKYRNSVLFLGVDECDLTPDDLDWKLEAYERPAFRKLYCNPLFESWLHRNHSDKSYSWVISLFRAVIRHPGLAGKNDYSDSELLSVLSDVDRNHKKYLGREVIGPNTGVVFFTNEESRFSNNNLFRALIGFGTPEGKIIGKDLKGAESKQKILLSISKIKGKSTIIYNGHGAMDTLLLTERCLNPEPEGINYMELGDAIIASNNPQLCLVLLSCYSYDFAQNLIRYLKENNARYIPLIITATNKDHASTGGAITRDLVKDGGKNFRDTNLFLSFVTGYSASKERIKLSDFVNGERHVYFRDDPAIFVPNSINGALEIF